MVDVGTMSRYRPPGVWSSRGRRVRDCDPGCADGYLPCLDLRGSYTWLLLRVGPAVLDVWVLGGLCACLTWVARRLGRMCFVSRADSAPPDAKSVPRRARVRPSTRQVPCRLPSTPALFRHPSKRMWRAGCVHPACCVVNATEVVVPAHRAATLRRPRSRHKSWAFFRRAPTSGRWRALLAMLASVSAASRRPFASMPRDDCSPISMCALPFSHASPTSTFLVDSGAGVTVLRAETWDHLGMPPQAECSSLDLRVASGQTVPAFGGLPLFGFITDYRGRRTRVMVAASVWTSADLRFDLFSTGQGEREQAWFADIGRGVITAGAHAIEPGLRARLYKDKMRIPHWDVLLEPFERTVECLGDRPIPVASLEAPMPLSSFEGVLASSSPSPVEKLRSLDGDAFVLPEAMDDHGSHQSSSTTRTRLPMLKAMYRTGRPPPVDVSLFRKPTSASADRRAPPAVEDTDESREVHGVDHDSGV